MKRKYHKDVHYVCKLAGIKHIEKEFGKLKNYDVVLTDERKQHILERKELDGLDVLINLKESIEKYDYLLDAGDKAVKYIKINKDRNYAFIVKLSLSDKTKVNSIISGMIINGKKIKKYIFTKKIIDTKV